MTWQGWLVLALHVAAIAAAAVALLPQRWGMFLLAFAGLSLSMLLLGHIKGKRVEGIGQ